MPVRLEDARITVEIDIRRATAEVREVESALENARKRRRPGARRVDPGKDPRVAARNLGAIGAFGAGRAAAGGLGKAIGLAAKVGAIFGGVQAVIAAPAVLPSLLGEETLRKEIIPDAFEPIVRLIPGLEKLLGREFIEEKTVNDLLDDLRRTIADVEAAVLTIADTVRLGADLFAEGKFVEAGFKINAEAQKGLSQVLKGERISVDLGLPEDVTKTFNAFSSYNRARSLQKQYARRSGASEWIDNNLEAFKAGGGGANR